MKVNGPELLLTIEGTLLGCLPLPVALALRPDVDVSSLNLGSWAHGQALDWQEAWAALCHPDFRHGWRVVPLRGGQLLLGHTAALPDDHRQAADLWQDRAAGLLALVSATAEQDNAQG
ncbi:hypothetical protein DM785_16505 (plasmid) [Deinococcus actinosclerus]|nr:hypothetical protein DM785_16505 [Deinococcus actinosclerus]